MRPALNDAQAAPLAACSAIASLLPATAQIVAGRPGQVGEVIAKLYGLASCFAAMQFGLIEIHAGSS